MSNIKNLNWIGLLALLAEFITNGVDLLNQGGFHITLPQVVLTVIGIVAVLTKTQKHVVLKPGDTAIVPTGVTIEPHPEQPKLPDDNQLIRLK